MVEQWSEAGLKTFGEVEAFYKAEKTGSKAVEEPETNVPKWSKSDYVNPLDPKIIDELEEFHKLNGTFDTPEAQAEIAKKRAEIEQGRANLEVQKQALLKRLDGKDKS